AAAYRLKLGLRRRQLGEHLAEVLPAGRKIGLFGDILRVDRCELPRSVQNDERAHPDLSVLALRLAASGLALRGGASGRVLARPQDRLSLTHGDLPGVLASPKRELLRVPDPYANGDLLVVGGLEAEHLLRLRIHCHVSLPSGSLMRRYPSAGCLVAA